MFRDDLLRNKRILITGGGTGLGKAMAHRFLQLGATVYICGRRKEVLEKTAAELSAHNGPIHALPCDVRNLEAVEAMIDTIWKAGPLDVLVNNAAGNFIARTEELSPRAFESVIGIVLLGTLHATMACGRRWLKSSHPGTVLSISATYAPVGSAYVVPSAVSKAGVEALTRSLAVEWGNRGIRMNAIAPGPIPTQGAFSRVLPRPELEALALDRNPHAPLRHDRRIGQPRRVLGKRRLVLYQRRSRPHGRWRIPARRWRIQHPGPRPDEKDWESLKPRKKS